MILGLLLACPSGEPTVETTLAALRSGDPAALDAELARFSDPRARDLVLLELAVAEPSAGGKLCAKVTPDAGKEKCAKVIGRPHLQGPGR